MKPHRCLVLILFFWKIVVFAGPSWYPVGVDLGYCERKGFMDFGNGREQEIGKKNLWLINGIIGRRYAINPGVRLQSVFSLGYGSVAEDTLVNQPLDDGTTQALELRSQLLHIGFIPELQFPNRVSGSMETHAGVGFGVHYTKLDEAEYIVGKPNLRVKDSYLEKSSNLSLSVHGGFGVDLTLQKNLRLSLGYTLRYWRPVKYGSTRDLFPLDPVDYSERFLTHSIQIAFLVDKE